MDNLLVSAPANPATESTVAANSAGEALTIRKQRRPMRVKPIRRERKQE